MMSVAAALGVALACALLLARLVRGATPFDRLLISHALWVNAALMVACLATFAGDAAWLDAALALALLDAVLVLAAVKALRRNSFQPPLAPLDESVAP